MFLMKFPAKPLGDFQSGFRFGAVKVIDCDPAAPIAELVSFPFSLSESPTMADIRAWVFIDLVRGSEPDPFLSAEIARVESLGVSA